MKYIVPIVYRGQSNFAVEAETPADAAEEARRLFKGGEPPTECGNEWEDIERIGTPEPLSAPPAPTTITVVFLNELIEREPDATMAGRFRAFVEEFVSFGDARYTIADTEKLMAGAKDEGVLSPTMAAILEAIIARGDLIALRG
jgi:hypothetical protein